MNPLQLKVLRFVQGKFLHSFWGILRIHDFERCLMEWLIHKIARMCCFNRLCKVSSGCDVFHYRKDNGNCRFSPNNPTKGRINLVHNYQGILKRPFPNEVEELIFFLDCSTPQENILRNSDFFTHTHLRTQIL